MERELAQRACKEHPPCPRAPHSGDQSPSPCAGARICGRTLGPSTRPQTCSTLGCVRTIPAPAESFTGEFDTDTQSRKYLRGESHAWILRYRLAKSWLAARQMSGSSERLLRACTQGRPDRLVRPILEDQMPARMMLLRWRRNSSGPLLCRSQGAQSSFLEGPFEGKNTRSALTAW